MPSFESSFRARGYQHFDIPPGIEGAKRLATDKHRVEKHAFYPFIRREVHTPRYHKSLAKVEDKVRCVDYASHADAAIYGWYGALLSERYELLLSSSGEPHDLPIAYRKLSNQCNIHFAARAFGWVRDHLPCVVLCFDIEGFFDTLDHHLLKHEWISLLNIERLPRDHFQVFKSLTRYSFVPETQIHDLFGRPRRRRNRSSDGKRHHAKRTALPRLCSPQDFRSLIRAKDHIHPNPRTGQGIPQGSPMSGVLSNIYMLPFDRTLQNFAHSCGGFAQRYSDDVLVVVPLDFAEAAKEVVFKAARERRLKVHSQAPKLDEKVFEQGCQVTPIPQPIQYLGFTFDGKNIHIRPQTWSRQCRKVRSYLRRAAKHASLNPDHRKVYRKTFQRRFTDRGECNFGSYARRSGEVTASCAVNRQWKEHQNHVRRWLDEFNIENQERLENKWTDDQLI